MENSQFRWPGEKPIAVLFNICLEAWSDGVAPGISPMGNPLPPGVLDTMAISRASYGPKCGIYRLLDALAAHNAKASVMTNAVIAERMPEAIKVTAEGGHEILSHSYAMDVIPAQLSPEQQKQNIARCSALLSDISGKPVQGWLSPRGTSGPDHHGCSPKRDINGTVMSSTATCFTCRILAPRKSSPYRWLRMSTTCPS